MDGITETINQTMGIATSRNVLPTFCLLIGSLGSSGERIQKGMSYETENKLRGDGPVSPLVKNELRICNKKFRGGKKNQHPSIHSTYNKTFGAEKKN